MEKDRGGGEAIVLEIATEITPTVTRVPRRIRERLLSDCSKKSLTSVQDIEDKLLHAHLRRQVFFCFFHFFPRLSLTLKRPSL